MDYVTTLQGTMYQMLGPQFAEIYCNFANKRAEDVTKKIKVPALKEYEQLMLYLTCQTYWRDNTDRFTIFMYKCGINMTCPEYVLASKFKKTSLLQEALAFMDNPQIKDRPDTLACLRQFSSTMYHVFNNTK